MSTVPETRSFTAPTRICCGLGARATLATELTRLGAGRVALVADQGIVEQGLIEEILRHRGDHEIVHCASVPPDPDLQVADRAAAEAEAAGCDAVLAIGGGSAIGAGKAVALALTNGSPVGRLAGRDQATRLPSPCLAMPTTAGSGSEVSNALVLHDPNSARVVVIRGDGYQPRTAILDGHLLATLPEAPLIHAALDALSHALEALWAKQASRFTDGLALAAAAHICAALPPALETRDPTALQRLLEAAAMANLSCGPSGLGAVHALVSSGDVHLAHGYQVAVLLPHVAEFNRSVVPPEAIAAIEDMIALYERIEFLPRFDPEELEGSASESMVSAALSNPFLENNRRPMDAGDLRQILIDAEAPIVGAKGV